GRGRTTRDGGELRRSPAPPRTPPGRARKGTRRRKREGSSKHLFGWDRQGIAAAPLPPVAQRGEPLAEAAADDVERRREHEAEAGHTEHAEAHRGAERLA